MKEEFIQSCVLRRVWRNKPCDFIEDFLCRAYVALRAEDPRKSGRKPKT
jgi:hypothetical protein